MEFFSEPMAGHGVPLALCQRGLNFLLPVQRVSAKSLQAKVSVARAVSRILPMISRFGLNLANFNGLEKALRASAGVQ